MIYELTKSEKKVARSAIDKGLEAEFMEGMEKFEAILKDWRLGKFADNKDAYQKLYKAVNAKDGTISRRYDGLTGGRYLKTVFGILRDGYITEDDIAGFSEETKTVIQNWLKVL